MNTQSVREIYVRDMFYRILLKWRGILAGALAFALLFGIFAFGKELKAADDPVILAELQEKNGKILTAYQNKAADLQDTIASCSEKSEALKAQIQALENAEDDLKAYSEHSVFVRIDPLNKWTATISLYIDADYHPDPMLGALDPDPTNSLIAAYNYYLLTGELFDEVMRQSDLAEDETVLKELLSTSFENATLRIVCIGDSEAFVREYMDLVKQGLERKHQDICDTIAEHEIRILSDTCYLSADTGLYERQQEKLAPFEERVQAKQEAEWKLRDLEKQIRDAKQALGDLEEPEIAELGRSYFVKRAVSKLVYGLIGGLLVMVLYYAVRYIFRYTMNTDNDWQSIGVPVLGLIQAEAGKKRSTKLDRWILRRLAGGSVLSREDGCRLAANNLRAILGEKTAGGCTLVSDMAPEDVMGIVDEFNRAETGVSFTLLGNLLSDAEVSKRLEKADNIVLMARNGKTTMDSARRELALLRAGGKTVLGVIVLE